MSLFRAVQHVCYSYSSGSFLDAVQNVSILRRTIIVSCAGLVASAGVFLLKHSPGGSGGKLNERIWFHSGRMAELKSIAQAVLSITIVGMGASLGRETAPKQTGAAIGSWLSRRAGLSSAESRLLVACGTGAGMGAVYNVPLGGALFTLEVLLGTLALPLIPPALAASFIATAVSWLILPDATTYTVAAYPVTLTQLIWSLGFGPIAGLASVVYVRLIVFADGVEPKRGVALVLPVAAFAALGLLAIPFPQLLGNGKDIAQLAFTGALGLPLLLALALLKPLATAGCLGSGAPGGLFTPSLAVGAILGGLLGQVWSLFWPGAIPGSYALIGAAAFMAASMQAPIAAVVLLLELTHNMITLMVPILFAVAGAATVARRLDSRSVYSGRVHTGKEAAVAEVLPVDLRYRDLLLPEVRTISLAASYPEVLERFVAEAGVPRPLYVIDERGRLSGRIEVRNVACPPALTQVLSAAAACDLMERIEPLSPALSRPEALARLIAEPSGELPVVDTDFGRLLGVAARS
jgi:H+/Cl- antiporter ClcA